MLLVGLTGFARAGKDTVADHLVEQHGFEKRSFAAPLKGMLRTMNPIIGYDIMLPGRQIRVVEALELYGEDGVKKVYPDYRKLLQLLGTDCVRAYDDEFWVRAAMKDLDPNGRYVFPDTRFPNEGDAIHNRGGQVWQVTRPGVEAVNAHISEQYVGHMGEDLELLNDGSIGQLSTRIDQAFATITTPEGIAA